MNPRISVLMSVYNSEQYLEDAIESILGQTFHDFEFIIIDDGSSDSTPYILARYQQRDPRILVHRFDNNCGLSTAMNLGIRHAPGENIARMDADDISLPQRLEKQVAFMDEHKEVDLCGAWMQTIGENEGTIWGYPQQHEAIHAHMLFANSFGHPAVMWRAAVFIQLGLLYDENIRFAQDYELWSRALLCARVANLGEVLVLYRIHHASIGATRREDQIATHRMIYQRLLAPLLAPTEKELELHQKISANQNDDDLLYLRQARNWLEKLSKLNREKGLFPPPMFDVYLGYHWSMACFQSRTSSIRLFLEILACPLQFRERSGVWKIYKAMRFFLSRPTIAKKHDEYLTG